VVQAADLGKKDDRRQRRGRRQLTNRVNSACRDLSVGREWRRGPPLVGEALVLRYQPDFLNILPLYVVLLAMVPFVLLLLRSHSLLPMILSGAVYLLTWWFLWSLPGHAGDDGWYFNPLAWQFPFIAGATAGDISSAPQTLSLRMRL
jgi:hypothetical protein